MGDSFTLGANEWADWADGSWQRLSVFLSKHVSGSKKGLHMVSLHIPSFPVILLAGGILALPLAAHATDRGNANTSDGAFSLYALTTGWGNTAMGYDSMRFNTTGSYNTGIGFQALDQNNSAYNCALGYQALYSTTTGSSNVGSGYRALYGNTRRLCQRCQRLPGPVG
jgi:hypothetical protein